MKGIWVKISNFFFGWGGLGLLSFFGMDGCQQKPYPRFVLLGSPQHRALQKNLTQELSRLPFVLESYQKKGHALDIEVAQCGPVMVANHCDNGYEFIHVHASWAHIQSDTYSSLKDIMHLIGETQLLSADGPLEYRLDEYISHYPCDENQPCARCIDAAHTLRCSMIFFKRGDSFLTRRLLQEVLITTKNGKRIGLLT